VILVVLPFTIHILVGQEYYIFFIFSIHCLHSCGPGVVLFCDLGDLLFVIYTLLGQ